MFSWQDYVLFVSSLAVPLAIGLFFFLRRRRHGQRQSVESFLVGDRSLNVVAVGMSLIASILNAVFVIGLPAEVHYHGTEVTYMVVAALVITVLGAHVFIPHYQRLQCTSAYEVNRTIGLYSSLCVCVSVR